MKLYELLNTIDSFQKCCVLQEQDKEIKTIATTTAESLSMRVLPLCVLNKDVAYINTMNKGNAIIINILITK